MKVSGIVCMLYPSKVEGMVPGLDVEMTETILFGSENFREIRDAGSKSYSQIDSVLAKYASVYTHLARHYSQAGNQERAKKVFDRMRTTISKNMVLGPEMEGIFRKFEVP